MTEIVTLTINPAIDIFVNVARVEPTRKLRCSPPKRDPGGGGINVARVAHRLGGDVTAIYPIGGQIGKLLQRLLEREDVASLVTPSHVETRENFTAYEESTGKQYRFVLPGSPLHRAEWEAVLDRLASLAEWPKFVVASGSVPPGAPDDFFARVARHAKAERAWQALPLDIEAVSTVGAGDSFLGGLVAALADGKPLDEAFRVAVAAASAAVLMPGTGLCQPEDVKRLLPQVKIKEIVPALA